MSTKIYNGYTLSITNLKELNEFILRFKEDTEKIVNRNLTKFMANIAVHMADDLIHLDEERFLQKYIPQENKKTVEECRYIGIGRQIYHEAEKRFFEVKRTQEKDPAVDFDTHLCLIPLNNKSLVLLFTVQKEITDLFTSYKEVSYYGYWDNTDKEEHCTEEEWKEREKDWNEAFENDDVPENNGMTITIIDRFPPYYQLDFSDCFNDIRSFENRVHEAARKLVKEFDESVFRKDFPELKKWIEEKTNE